MLNQAHLQDKATTLLSRMSLSQKIGQMTQADQMTCAPEDVKHFHLGAVLSSAGSCPETNTLESWVNLNDSFWQASMSADDLHLPIPILYGLDAIHGNNNVKGATIFPHNIGLGAANDISLMAEIARATAKEVLASGVDWAFAPNLAVARDVHWGRTYESYSEHPDIVTAYAKAMVQGLQDDLGDSSVLACIKHWVGDGGTQYGIDQGDTKLSEQKLKNIHVLPYISAINAGALTVMASFSSWNGDKCHAHRYLLTEVLKNQLGFEGFVVSDMQGIDHVSDDFYLAVEKGVNAGIDMFMVPENWQLFIHHMHRHVEMGTIAMARIDDAVKRILSVKLAFGLFDKPRPKQRSWSNHNSFGAREHRQLARDAVRKSLVMLKNQANTLPLSKRTRLLVAGKNADNLGFQSGGFTLEWQGVDGNEQITGTSVWQAVKSVCRSAQLSDNLDGVDADPRLHDVALVVIGEKPYAEGLGDIRIGDNLIVEAGSKINGQLNVLEPCGDSLELCHLYPEDLQTIQTIAAKGITVVTLLISGRPLVINQELEASSAFIAAWLPGSEGAGITDVLFGDYDFQGKLSFSWPKSSHPTVNVGDPDYEPLFAYGYGLTYSHEQQRRAYLKKLG